MALAAWIAPAPQAVIAGYARPSEFVAHIDMHRAVQFIRHRNELHILSTLLGVKEGPADHEVRIRPRRRVEVVVTDVEVIDPNAACVTAVEIHAGREAIAVSPIVIFLFMAYQNDRVRIIESG